MITGSLGQIGSELVEKLRELKGKENVIATDIRRIEGNFVVEDGIFEELDVMDYDRFLEKYPTRTLSLVNSVQLFKRTSWQVEEHDIPIEKLILVK